MCGLMPYLKIKCNCLCQTIHIKGCPLLLLAISKWDFVFSLSYGVWPDNLSLLTHSAPCLCPGTGFWRGQLLVALLPFCWKVLDLGVPFGVGVKTQLFQCASSLCSWQVFLPASGCYWLPPHRSREDTHDSRWFWFSRDLYGFWCLRGIRNKLP